ncbi:MAG TPA: GNAT family N-acetyltransferase [Desertimonas sp.]|nr:GNAT family N-acetyltransferase [Desertimonas sp.]
MEPGERLTTDQREIDHRAVWQWLHDDSYWARGRPWALQERAVAGSRCFAVIGPDGDTRAFCRLVTDGATFAWLADVVVLPPFRGRGLGKDLVSAVVGSQHTIGIRRLLLRTNDADGLYAQFGFAPVETGFMERVVSDQPEPGRAKAMPD